MDSYLEAVASGVLGAALLWNYTRHKSSVQLLPFTRSSIDGLYYRVMPSDNAVDAANQLCRVKQSVQKVLEYLAAQSMHPPEVAAGVQRLLNKHPNADTINVVELHPDDAKHTLAFNEGKSTVIFLCMRQNPPSTQLGSDDVLLYIVLHELAHSMIAGYAPMNEAGQTIHDRNFRTHNEYLNRVAETLGLLRPGKVPGRQHCGVIMPNPDDAV